MSDWRHPRPVDTAKYKALANARDTARATAASRELIERLVEHTMATAKAAEVRERQMVRWTEAGVALAAVAGMDDHRDHPRSADCDQRLTGYI